MQAQFELKVAASEIGQYLGALKKEPAKVQEAVALWPASDAKELILAGLAKEIEELKSAAKQEEPTAVPEGEVDTGPPVDEDLKTALTNLKKTDVDKFVPEAARPDVNRAIDDVVRCLGTKGAGGGALRAAWQRLLDVVDGLTKRGMKALQVKALLKQPLERRAEQMEEAAVALDKLRG
jgi:hypothetical protein